MTWSYPEARDGNVALIGAIDLAHCGGEVVIALGFGRNQYEAGQQARASLLCRFEDLAACYVEGWRNYQARCRNLSTKEKNGFDLYRVATAVLKNHESKRFAGGLIASLSLPWGMAKGDGDLGGYHVVWPRDQVEAAGAMLATDNAESGSPNTFLSDVHAACQRTLARKICGLMGSPIGPACKPMRRHFRFYWPTPLRRRNALNGLHVWPMVRLAAQFLVSNGPVSPQDRWEEKSGYSVFTPGDGDRGHAGGGGLCRRGR